MMAETLFRNEVIEAHRERLTGTVVAAVPPSSRLYTRLILGLVGLIILILVFGSYASSTQVRGIVAYDRGIARVYPSGSGEVRAIHVRNGQRVAAGTPLVTLAPTQGIGGVTPQLLELEAQRAEIERQIAISANIGDTDQTGLSRQRDSLAAAIGSLERQKTIASGQINLAEAALRRATQLAAEGAGTQRQVEDSRSMLLARRAEYEAIGERLINQRDSLRSIESDLRRRNLESTQNRSVLLAQRAGIAEQRASLSRSDQITLTAPVDGVVGDVSVQPGQRARPEASIVTVVPANSRLEVWLYAPSRAIGFSRPGQRVRLRFDAFPYQKYGVGTGVVTHVSRVPIEPGAIDGALEFNEPVFRVRVRIESFAPRVPTNISALRPGMTLSANLVLERRSLWEVLFNPVREALRT
jgi:membrane fusion protein